jgi:3-hydroxyisobutyrate dehydrogenase-like beta-hydroxyacid dehydrogenase
VIGTGIMGHGIATNYLKHQYPLFVWNRDASKTDDLVKAGAIATSTPREAAEKSDIVFEVTANDESSQSVWRGQDGIVAGAKPRTIVIACATLSMDWIHELIGLADKKKLYFFDMGMTGGRQGAEAGKLTFLTGGDETILATLKSDLQAVSEKIIYFGPAGSGMRYKLLLNMLQAIHVAGFAEALRIASTTGMDVQAVGNALAERPGGVITNLAWRDYQKKPDPINFSVQWIAKDLTYAKKMAGGISTPLLDKTLDKFHEAIKRGLSTEDWTEITRF